MITTQFTVLQLAGKKVSNQMILSFLVTRVFFFHFKSYFFINLNELFLIFFRLAFIDVILPHFVQQPVFIFTLNYYYFITRKSTNRLHILAIIINAYN